MYLFNYHICMYLNIYLCLFIMPKWSELYIYFIPFPTVLHCDVLEWCSTSHAFSMVFHSSWVNVDMAKFTKARVVMMASLSLPKRFSMKKVEFHQVGQSCRSFRSICASVPLSFSADKELQWKWSTMCFTPPPQTIELSVWVKQCRCFHRHFWIARVKSSVSSVSYVSPMEPCLLIRSLWTASRYGLFWRYIFILPVFN